MATETQLDSPTTIRSASFLYFANMLPTPDRSVPSSPTLSPAAVTHANATTRHLHTNDASAVDSMELTKLLQHVASNKKPPTSPITTASTSSTNSSVSSLRPSLPHRSSSRNVVPSQFIFKKPLYNQHYHQTHFHHSLPPSPPTTITPSHTHTSDVFLSELKRFFVSPSETQQENQPFANQFRQNISSRYGQWGMHFIETIVKY